MSSSLEHLKVLYVEDEPYIREELTRFLNNHVKAVYSAENGVEGWRLFQERDPDIIISDINMPKMNGIELAQKIKEADRRKPIILLTAFNESSYMMEAISAGVSHYLLKPIKTRKLLETMQQVSRELALEAMEAQHLKDTLMIETLNGFMQSSPNAIIIYEEDRVKYVNRQFQNYIAEVEPGEPFALEECFEKRAGYITSLDEVCMESDTVQKVSIPHNGRRRLYQILCTEVATEGAKTYLMYTLNEVTLVEYHKLKVAHYTLRLEDFIRQINRSRGAAAVHFGSQIKPADRPDTPAKPLETQSSAEPVSAPSAEERQRSEKRTLAPHELAVLKKSRDGRHFSAAEYAQEIDEYVLQELQELEEIEAELLEDLKELEELRSDPILGTISGRLRKYAMVIAKLFEFDDLAFAMESLADLIATMKMASVDDTKLRKFELFVSNFMLDMASWRNAIFIEKSANDIHYMDASLFSAILQLELIINENQALVEDESAEDEDDLGLELF